MQDPSQLSNVTTKVERAFVRDLDCAIFTATVLSRDVFSGIFSTRRGGRISGGRRLMLQCELANIHNLTFFHVKHGEVS